jgi:hypothetical protein
MSLQSSSSEERFTTSESASPTTSSGSSNDNSPNIRNKRPRQEEVLKTPGTGIIDTPPTIEVDEQGNILPNQYHKLEMHEAYQKQRLESTLYVLTLHNTTLFTKYGDPVYDIHTISKSQPLFHLTEATRQQINDWKAGKDIQLYNYKGELRIPGGLFNSNIGGRRYKKTRKHSKKNKSRSNRKRRTKHKR